MKKNLSTGAIAAIASLVIVAIIVYGFIVMKPDFGAAPVVKPKPFQPPAAYQRGMAGGHGAPIGAPDTAK